MLLRLSVVARVGLDLLFLFLDFRSATHFMLARGVAAFFLFFLLTGFLVLVSSCLLSRREFLLSRLDFAWVRLFRFRFLKSRFVPRSLDAAPARCLEISGV